MLLEVINAKALPDYRVYLEFNDEASGIVDLTDTVYREQHPMIREL
jgi:hypothetical protein